MMLNQIALRTLLCLVLVSATYAQEPVELTLSEAIDLALDKNENILIASNDVRNARQMIREAWADVLPDVRFNALYTRNFVQPVFFFPDPVTGEQTAFPIGSTNAYRIIFTLEQPIYQAGKTSKAIKVAKLFQEYSDEGFRGTRAEVTLEVKKAFYLVLLNEQVQEINRQSLEQQYKHLVNARKLFREGQVSELDTLRAWVDYTNLQPPVIRAENALLISKSELKVLIGIDLDQPISLKGALDYDATNGVSLAELIEEAQRNRPELKQLQYETEMQYQNIGITRANYLPKIFLSGTYESVAQSDELDFGSGFNDAVYGAIRFEIPIFDGFRSSAQAQQAKLDYENSQYRKTLFEDKMEIEINSILLNLQEASRRVEVQRHAINQAERALFMAERRYNEGVSTQTEIGDALLALNLTKTNYVQAVYDHKVALAALHKAIGRE